MKGKLYLSGGGSERKTEQVDRLFVDDVISRGDRVLYIPTALNRTMIGFEACIDWFSRMISSHTQKDIDITTWIDLEGKTFAMLEQFDAIYIGGGNTYKLRSILKSTGLDVALVKYLERGGLVYGGSAGAIIFGKTLYPVQEENDAHYSVTDGMGLVGRYSLRCHFTEADLRQMKLIAKHTHLHIMALPEGSCVVVSGEDYKALGSGIVLIEMDGAVTEVYDGETGEIV